MTSSRSNTSTSEACRSQRGPSEARIALTLRRTGPTRRSSWLAFAITLLVGLGIANAGGRKRVVVLDFDGPKAEQFHDDIVKLIKKSHTVVATDKWNGAAEELDATKVTEKNVKKVAKKLKIDGIITGKIEKRRDDYLIHLKLRSGSTGELVGNRIDTKADDAHVDGKAAREIKDELVGAIDELEANHGGGGDEEETPKKSKKSDDDADDTKPKKLKKSDDDADDTKPKKSKKSDDDADDTKPKKSKKSDDDADDTKPKKSKKSDDDADSKPKKSKKSDDDADDSKPKKSKKSDDEAKTDDDADTHRRHKKTADEDEDARPRHHKHGGDDEEDGIVEHADQPLDPDTALSPGHRAVDFVIGMSFTARRLSFASTLTANQPPSYKQTIPVAGGVMDATVYPMAFSHKDKGAITGLGVEVMYDKVIHINSSKTHVDPTSEMQITANLPTLESRFSIGAVFRYPVSPALVVGGKLMYSNQQFSVQQTLPNMTPTDIPNVNYNMVEPKGFLKYTVSPAINISLDGGFMLLTSTGNISKEGMDGGYGANKASGYEFSGRSRLRAHSEEPVRARAEAKLETVSMTFKGSTTALSNTRDNDATTQDVSGAKDLYFGGMGTIGYIY